MRPAAMPARLEALRPEIDAWCAELAAAPGGSSLDHNDLHPRNMLFAGDGSLVPVRFYDWGDAVLAHPFASVRLPLGMAEPGERAPFACLETLSAHRRSPGSRRR